MSLKEVGLKRSHALGLILKHWIGDIPVADEPGQVAATLPFDLENFCRETDALLDLLETESRELYAKKTILPVTPREGVHVWKVMEGSEFDKRRSAAIAWFREDKDLNRFLFKPDERVKLESEVKRLEKLLDENNFGHLI